MMGFSPAAFIVEKVVSYRRVEYEKSKNTYAGIVNRIIQAFIILYVFGFVLLYSKGYQSIEQADIIVFTKVKGVSVTNFPSDSFQIKENRELYNRVWDSYEYSSSSSGDMGFFIMTNLIITPNQTQGICPEDYKINRSVCKKNSDCPVGKIMYMGHGRNTGNCTKSPRKEDTKVCEIEGWCPVEYKQFPLKNNTSVLAEAGNFTVLIKSHVYFHQFGENYKRTSLPDEYDKEYIRSCTYDKKTARFCPIFKIRDLVEMAKVSFEDVSYLGAIMGITITWDCNLDRDFYEYCRPKYKIRRIDNTKAGGFNYRHAEYIGLGKRNLFKLHGIKFIIEAQARGRKFSIIPTIVNLATGMALLKLSSWVTELVILIQAQVKNKKNENKENDGTDEPLKGEAKTKETDEKLKSLNVVED